MTAFVVHDCSEQDWSGYESLLQTMFPHLEIVAARLPSMAASFVRDALKHGHLDIIVVGGDGLINEVVNGFFVQDYALSPDAVLSIVARDGDIGRSFGLAVEPDAAIAQLRRARIRKFDVGCVSCVSEDGGPVRRYFLGAASFGVTARIARALGRARIAKFFGARFARALHAPLALLGWRGCHVRLMADHGADEIAGIASVAIANGSRFGGGMRLPGALPNDGMFDLGVMAGARRRWILRELARAREGETTPAGMRILHSTRLTAAPTLETRGPVYVETDGEVAGKLPASFEILPGAIQIRA